LIASVIGSLCLLMLIELGLLTAQMARRQVGLARGLARGGTMLGLLMVAGGGMANWLFSLQGAVIVTEGDEVPLLSGTHLQEFEEGPLSNPSEMHLFLRVDRVKLQAGEGGGIAPTSHLRLTHADGTARQLELSPGQAASEATLRFHQGAFGYSPRIVIIKDDKTLFDRVVPFTTRKLEARSVVFEGEVRVEEHDLQVRGALNLDTLDPDMRGHPNLTLEVSGAGKDLGSGRLTLGHFAELADGYRVGFAGLHMWTEVVLSRQTYTEPMVAGMVVALVGGLFWLAAGIRRSR
jgi:hypothetical protein